MCNNCDKKLIYPVKDNCFQVEDTKCDVGCEQVLSTECIFHNINNDDQSSKLTNIGVYAGASLSYIIKQINKKFGEYLSADFSAFNMNGLNSSIPIDDLKSFVESVTAALKVLRENDLSLATQIDSLSESLSNLQTLVIANNKPQISSSDLNISNTNTVKEVLEKIISYIEDLEITSNEYDFQDSESVEFSKSGNSVTANFKISEKAGNRIVLEEDGAYATDSSVTSTLNIINSDPNLKALFTDLVKSSLPCFYFDILSTKNQNVSYFNCLGDKVAVTIPANKVVSLTDVRRIITVPGAELTITFKGI
jgi:hypothetical protein